MAKIDKLNRKLEEIFKRNSFMGSFNDIYFSTLGGDNEEPTTFMNPRNQTCFRHGRFTIDDFLDWENGTGKVVRGESQEEKDIVMDVVRFDEKHAYSYLFSTYFHDFDLIGDFGINTEESSIASALYGVSRYYYDYKNIARMRHELDGAAMALEEVGIGYFGAVNTSDPKNLSYMKDVARSKALYLYHRDVLKDLPNYERFLEIVMKERGFV